jgi:hypothetical protein
METNGATFFPFQNVRPVLPLSLIPLQTTSSILYLRVSRYDAVWVFQPSMQCVSPMLRPGCLSRIFFPCVDLLWLARLFFGCVRVTLTCHP